ncbi:MAG: ATP-binding protein [Ferruginibacter sp.]|nr:ATP-binding protein [Ferruginibacter sp.]
MIKKIVIIGPESTGKSTLCEQLAVHFGTRWVREFAREYLQKNGTKYTYDDLLDIAKGQLALEDSVIASVSASFAKISREAESSHPTLAAAVNDVATPIFVDTDMYVLKVWSEFVFGKCHHWILNQIVERKYDLYLLCDIDLPWIQDELREYPDRQTREKLFHHYKDILVNQPVPWVAINGNYEERLRKAIEAVNKIL